MKKMVFFFLLLSLLVSCGKKEEVDKDFTEFTEKIDKDMQDLFEKKDADTTSTEKEEVQPQEKIEPEETKPVEIKEEAPEVAMVEPIEEEKKVETTEKPVSKIEIADVETSELSTAELWEAYNQAKKELEAAQEQKQFDNILASLQKTTKYSQELKRDDIAAWQLNNIGYYSIEEFKRRINYDARMNRLNQMPSGDEKRAYYLETKEKITQEFPLLKNALPYLQKAQEIDKHLDNEKRTKIIRNNIQFIEYVSQAYIDE